MSIAGVAENRFFRFLVFFGFPFFWVFLKNFRFLKVFLFFLQLFMICLQMNAAAFVQMNEDILHWIRIGWYVGCQRYILYTVYIIRYVYIYNIYIWYTPFKMLLEMNPKKDVKHMHGSMENVTSGGPWGGTRIAATSTLNRGPIRSCHLHSCSPCQCHHLHLSFRLRCGQFLERDVISISSFPPLVFQCHQIVEIVVFKITDFEG